MKDWAWITGAALLAGGMAPSVQSLTFAVLYSLSAHGIMTLNDFKAIEGDRRMGVRSLPVQLGVDRAARLACWVMIVPPSCCSHLALVLGSQYLRIGDCGLDCVSTCADAEVFIRPSALRTFL